MVYIVPTLAPSSPSPVVDKVSSASTLVSIVKGISVAATDVHDGFMYVIVPEPVTVPSL